MNRIVEILKNAGIFHIATVDTDGQPRVRPFGAVTEFEGKAYICTNNTKKCYAEMIADGRTEISAMEPGGTWIRITAKLVHDDRDEARAAVLEDNESIQSMYHIGDGIFEVLYLEDAVCTRYSFTAEPVIIE